MVEKSEAQFGEMSEPSIYDRILAKIQKDKGLAGEKDAAVAQALLILAETADTESQNGVLLDAAEQVVIPVRLAEVFENQLFIELLLTVKQFQKEILDFLIFSDPTDCEGEHDLLALNTEIYRIATNIVGLDATIEKLFQAITNPSEGEHSLFNGIEPENIRWYRAAFKNLVDVWQVFMCPPDLKPEKPMFSGETAAMVVQSSLEWAATYEWTTKYGISREAEFPEIENTRVRQYLVFLRWFVEHRRALPRVEQAQLLELFSEVLQVSHMMVDDQDV